MKNSKENNWELFDRNYKKVIDSKVDLVNPDLWNKISKKLDLQKEKKKVLWWQNSNYRWAWAAILLIAIGISWQKFNPELIQIIQTNQIELSLKANSSSQKNSTKTNPSRVYLNPSVELVHQTKKKFIPLKSNAVESPMNHNSIETIAQVSLTDEVIKDESRSNISDENLVIKDEIIWVRVDIKPLEEQVKIMDELNSNFEKKPIRRKLSLLNLVQQIKHVLKGEFQEAEFKNSDAIFFENQVHQVANQYIKTAEIIKQKFQ